MPALSVSNLSKSYGQHRAIHNVSFSINPGQCLALLGSNGAGKTTTLECIFALRTPDTGSIRIADIDPLTHPLAAKKIIGVQLQSTALQDKITPRQALRLFASFYPNPQQPAALLDQFHLAEKADQPFDSLSAGQRQRLALALALIHNPQILFLDEPTAGLDPASRRDLLSLIASLKSQGKTILLTTHLIDDAHRLADTIAILHHGTLIAHDTPQNLLTRIPTAPSLTFTTANPLSREQFLTLPHITTATVHDTTATLTTTNLPHSLLALIHLLESTSNPLLSLHTTTPTLEDTYLHLTGQPLAPVLNLTN